MSTEHIQSSFEGFAVLELMGRNKEIGFVTTEYFGGPALFRVDQPALPEREIEISRPQWVGETLCPVGSKILREALPGKTVYVGPSSIFRMTPCTEETAMRAIESLIVVPVKILHLAEKKALPSGSEKEIMSDFEIDDDN